MLFSARSAKERKVRIWKDYVAPTANLDQKDRQFVAKVSSQSGTVSGPETRRCFASHRLASIKQSATARRLTLTTVALVTENSTCTFNGKKEIRAASRACGQTLPGKLEALPSQIRGPKSWRSPTTTPKS